MTDPKVYIVGAGPGDPELLTMKAYRLIRAAEVVVYDRLVPQAITKLIPKKTERVYAGKSCKTHHMTQDEINAELHRQAKLGRMVVRLKGGDPFIFGRGGEEMEYLLERGIGVEVVPGISSASGISSALGIPLTHRGLATGVRFITGHQQKGQKMNLNWKSLADPATTLVVYMGLAHLPEITTQLMKKGLDEKTPAAVIQSGTTPDERVLFTSLKKLAADVAKHRFEPPTLVVIGQVVQIAPGYPKKKKARKA